MKKAGLGAILLCSFGIWMAGCNPINIPPATYVETHDPGWKVIDLRQELDYDTAWQMLVDRIRKNYDIEIMDKDSGYLRTGWIYTESGTERSNYRSRVTLKFSPDKRKLELKADALFHRMKTGSLSGRLIRDYGWVPGTDTQLLNDVYGDISALLGRVRR